MCHLSRTDKNYLEGTVVVLHSGGLAAQDAQTLGQELLLKRVPVLCVQGPPDQRKDFNKQEDAHAFWDECGPPNTGGQGRGCA